MSRWKAPQYILDRREQDKAVRMEPVGRTKKIIKVVLGAAGLIATGLGIATGYLSLLPRITITQNQALDTSDPFSTPFVVSNDGPLGINDVKFVCWLQHVTLANNGDIGGFGTSSPALDIPDGMEVGEKTTLPCVFSNLFVSKDGTSAGNLVTYADIVIKASFRPDFALWHLHRNTRFKTVKGSDGRLYWYPYAYNRTPEAEARDKKESNGVEPTQIVRP